MTDRLLRGWFRKSCNKMPAEVSVYGLASDAVLLDKITGVVNLTLENNGLKSADFCLDVNFVDIQRMRELNKNFRKKDYATDVLSFGQFEDIINRRPKGLLSPIMLGDLVLCKEVIEKEALEENKNYEEQLLMLIEHGTLHLIGIHHPED